MPIEPTWTDIVGVVAALVGSRNCDNYVSLSTRPTPIEWVNGGF